MKQFLQSGRRVLKAVWIRLLFATGLLRWAKRRLASTGGVLVLTLHRVVPDSEYAAADSQHGMFVRASTFQYFIEYLQAHCHLVSINDVPIAKQHADMRPRVALTFDDGWKDNFATAFPIARKYALPFAVFICPEFIGGKGHFWTESVTAMWRAAARAAKLHTVQELARDRVNGSVDSLIEFLKQSSKANREAFIAALRTTLECSSAVPGSSDMGELLDWEDIRNMSEAGVQFGSHTSSHQILTQLSPEEALKELAESRSAIESQLKSCASLAYPNGDWSHSVRELVSRSGYQRAFINSPGLWKQNTNPLSIPRVNIWEGKLTGTHSRFSRMMVEYTVFWAAYRASRTKSC